jgi:hypothetical protein
MGQFKKDSMGDTAPSRAPYVPVGRFKIVSILDKDKVWIMDTETGEAGSFDAAKLEAVLLKFFSEEF